MTLDIDDVFKDLDKYYPGSKRQRRIEDAPRKVTEDAVWDSRPIKKMFKGKETEFFMPIALATALGKTSVTIRLWERRAYIPKAPFRLPGHTKAGKTVPGKRMYTREMIEVAVEEFAKRDLLGSARVEWKNHDDLTIALYERWNAIVENAN